MSICLRLVALAIAVAPALASVCVVSFWSEWASCVGNCEFALQVRNRAVVRPPFPERTVDGRLAIRPCPPLYQVQTCLPTVCGESSADSDSDANNNVFDQLPQLSDGSETIVEFPGDNRQQEVLRDVPRSPAEGILRTAEETLIRNAQAKHDEELKVDVEAKEEASAMSEEEIPEPLKHSSFLGQPENLAENSGESLATDETLTSTTEVEGLNEENSESSTTQAETLNESSESEGPADNIGEGFVVVSSASGQPGTPVVVDVVETEAATDVKSLGEGDSKLAPKPEDLQPAQEEERKGACGSEPVNPRCCRMQTRIRCDDGGRPQHVIRWARNADDEECYPYSYGYCGHVAEPDIVRPFKFEQDCYTFCYSPEEQSTLPLFQTMTFSGGFRVVES